MHLADDLGGPLAIDFVPARYRAHRAVRLLFPFRDRAHALVSWRDLIPADAALPASLGWHELLDRASRDPGDFEPASGILDEGSAAALADLIEGLEMTCLRWAGYGDGTEVRDPVDIDGARYARGPLDSAMIRAGLRVPSFAWDASGRLAWGSRLYPDSLVVAADLDHFRRMHADARLTATGVRTDRDVLPPSAGD